MTLREPFPDLYLNMHYYAAVFLFIAVFFQNPRHRVWLPPVPKAVSLGRCRVSSER